MLIQLRVEEDAGLEGVLFGQSTLIFDVELVKAKFDKTTNRSASSDSAAIVV